MDNIMIATMIVIICILIMIIIFINYINDKYLNLNHNLIRFSSEKYPKLSTIIEENYNELKNERISVSIIVEMDGKISAIL